MDDINRIEMEADDKRRNKYENKHGREDEESPKGLQTDEVLVCSILEFNVDHIKNLKLKDIKRSFDII